MRSKKSYKSRLQQDLDYVQSLIDGGGYIGELDLESLKLHFENKLDEYKNYQKTYYKNKKVK